MDDQTPDRLKKPKGRTALVLVAVGVVLLIQNLYLSAIRSESVPYSQFLAWIAESKIQSLVVGSQGIHGTLKPGAIPSDAKKPQTPAKLEFEVLRVEDPGLVERLTHAGIRFEATRENPFLRDALGWVLPALIMVAFWSFFLRRVGPSAGGGILGMGKSKARVFVEKDIHTRFGDVAGIDEAKQELQELVQFLKDPGRYGRLGGRVPKGILLVGPPGTGKTLAARAVAGEANVPFYSINGSEFVELFVGLGAARVRDLFAEARGSAPCIVFIDELDAIGKMRGVSAISGGANDEKEQTLNQLLAEIDGFDPSRGIVLLAATNRPEVLDPALLRSGRFDRQIVIDKPDRRGRKAILEIHLKKIRVSKVLDTDEIAALTAGFSGADLANLVNEATLIATRRNSDAVELADFTEAIERLVAGLERKTRALAPDEKKRVAFHEMGHAVLTMALGGNEQVQKVSIIPRGIGALGYNLRRPQEDRYLLSKPELERKLAVLLGGRASEELFLKEISTGAADDLDKATDLARAMVTRYGMSDSGGVVTYDPTSPSFLTGSGAQALPGGRIYSEATARELDQEVKGFLDRALSTATEGLQRHAAIVQAGVDRLLEREILTTSDLKEIWESSLPRK